jgi:hypothetical protein
MHETGISIALGYVLALVLFSCGIVALTDGQVATFFGCLILSAVCACVPAGVAMHLYPRGRGTGRDQTTPAEQWRGE